MLVTGQDALNNLLAEDERNLSWLSRRTGRSVSHLYRVSTGERDISPSLANDLAALFNVPIETFLTATTGGRPSPDSTAGGAGDSLPPPAHPTTTKKDME